MSTTAPTITRQRALPAWLQRRLARPELVPLLGLAAVLNLYALSINGWANTYYTATVRSMTTSWHNFLFVSADPSGLMTVDKPPLSLWVQALSARVFGVHPLSLLIPQALMGVAAVWLTYDLTRRRFGRAAGFIAGVVLATTPIAVAVSRHNNPDELLVLCCVAAAWAALRALDRSKARWLVLSGVCIGLGFETKMAVALMVLPGIVAAWIWVAPSGRLRALCQALGAGAAMVAVGGAWPLLVALTPAADRPWISATGDNSIWSLILGYNGLGRIAGQNGGPNAFPGGGGSMFGGATGPFRLLQSGLGEQAGWLLGFAIVAGVALLISTRLRRRDASTGWLITVGGAFATTAIAFSFASGIFHPYYVSLLAPFTAALIGAGAAQMLAKRPSARVLAPLAIAAGAVTELVVLGGLGGDLAWGFPVVVVFGVAGAVVLGTNVSARIRAIAVAVSLAALLAAPAAWAAATLGHATNGTLPAGGPSGSARQLRPGGPPAGASGAAGALGVPPQGPPGVGGLPPQGAPGGFGRNSAGLTAAISYTTTHGGGTIGVQSQSSAASAVVSQHASVAGLAGFSGRESSVTVAWLADAVGSGKLRWVLVDSGRSGPPGDTRSESSAAFQAVARVGRKVTLTTSDGSQVVLYDLQGKAAALRASA